MTGRTALVAAAGNRALGRVLRALSRWRGRSTGIGVPVLTYHSIGDEPWGELSRYRISRLRFRQHLSFLAMAGFEVVPLDTLVDHLATKPSSVPSTWVALTFDDGYEDFYLNALPELDAHGFPATVFVVSDLMGRSAEWLGPDAAPRMMTWPQARAALHAGIAFSSHSCTHPHLSQLDATTLSRELVKSRRAIEDQLGACGGSFCYPHGDFDGRVCSTVREVGYTAAFSTEVGLTGRGNDMHALPRVKVRPDDSIVDFAAKLVTSQGLPQRWRRLRARGAR
jgi:peptidoglycan/xylan/chitin deacetylase (PgdA/CDA1 family)